MKNVRENNRKGLGPRFSGPLIFALLALPALAQPTISPANPTVAVNGTVQFATSAKSPLWLLSGTALPGMGISPTTGLFTAPKVPATVTVHVYDKSAGYVNNQTTVTVAVAPPTPPVAIPPASGDTSMILMRAEAPLKPGPCGPSSPANTQGNVYAIDPAKRLYMCLPTSAPSGVTYKWNLCPNCTFVENW